MGWDWGWRPYVSVAQRQRRAEKEIARMKKKGRVIVPIRLDGRTIARTFWGKAWCDNLESYGDYENRLPRGRAYVRNGSVMDLQIAPGAISALVSGRDLYRFVELLLPRLGGMCKHVAASLYGVGARLDEMPELVFVLRQADHLELAATSLSIFGVNSRPLNAAADVSLNRPALYR